MPSLIGPDGLEADAVVPQCLDNQYVSDAIFKDMITRGVDYQDERVQQAREADFQTEFIRSLVYSSQVVIQRAFLKNSEFLYKNYLPENGTGLRAFAELMRQKAIVPYLYTESSLLDSLELDVRQDGDNAVTALLREVGDETMCVRLAVNDDHNRREALKLAGKFGSGLRDLAGMLSEQRNAMAAELFSDPAVLGDPEAWNKFTTSVDELARFSFEKSFELQKENRSLTRQDIYLKFFAEDARKESVSMGRFKAPDASNPFVLEVKKYVDLVYNTNLPDRLKRYTFTPVNLPSRMALQDLPTNENSHSEIMGTLDDERIEFLQRSFEARMQSAMTLPLLRELSLADVVEIRNLETWEQFKRAQTGILNNPVECTELMPGFQEKFDAFQADISHWYNLKYQRSHTLDRYCSYVSVAISIGGHLIVAGSNLGGMEKTAAGILISGAQKVIPNRVKGYAAKLMIGVYDVQQRRLDRDRSYTIELMQTGEELMREDVEDLLHRLSELTGPSLPDAQGIPADQGKQ